MAAALKVLKQKRGVNFETLVVQITLSGNYPGTPGEVISLNGATIPNTGAQVVTGPSVNPLIPPRCNSSLGGWQAQLTPTANPLEYDLAFFNGTVQLTAIAYPAVISGGVLTIEIDFGTGSFDS